MSAGNSCGRNISAENLFIDLYRNDTDRIKIEEKVEVENKEGKGY